MVLCCCCCGGDEHSTARRSSRRSDSRRSSRKHSLIFGASADIHVIKRKDRGEKIEDFSVFSTSSSEELRAKQQGVVPPLHNPSTDPASSSTQKPPIKLSIRVAQRLANGHNENKTGGTTSDRAGDGTTAAVASKEKDASGEQSGSTTATAHPFREPPQKSAGPGDTSNAPPAKPQHHQHKFSEHKTLLLPGNWANFTGRQCSDFLLKALELEDEDEPHGFIVRDGTTGFHYYEDDLPRLAKDCTEQEIDEQQFQFLPAVLHTSSSLVCETIHAYAERRATTFVDPLQHTEIELLLRHKMQIGFKLYWVTRLAREPLLRYFQVVGNKAGDYSLKCFLHENPLQDSEGEQIEFDHCSLLLGQQNHSGFDFHDDLFHCEAFSFSLVFTKTSDTLLPETLQRFQILNLIACSQLEYDYIVGVFKALILNAKSQKVSKKLLFNHSARWQDAYAAAELRSSFLPFLLGYNYTEMFMNSSGGTTATANSITALSEIDFCLRSLQKSRKLLEDAALLDPFQQKELPGVAGGRDSGVSPLPPASPAAPAASPALESARSVPETIRTEYDTEIERYDNSDNEENENDAHLFNSPRAKRFSVTYADTVWNSEPERMFAEPTLQMLFHLPPAKLFERHSEIAEKAEKHRNAWIYVFPEAVLHAGLKNSFTYVDYERKAYRSAIRECRRYLKEAMRELGVAAAQAENFGSATASASNHNQRRRDTFAAASPEDVLLEAGGGLVNKKQETLVERNRWITAWKKAKPEQKLVVVIYEYKAGLELSCAEVLYRRACNFLKVSTDSTITSRLASVPPPLLKQQELSSGSTSGLGALTGSCGVSDFTNPVRERMFLACLRQEAVDAFGGPDSLKTANVGGAGKGKL
ncbi:unnamed protein product [Amoebophrya sp. A120]|nr:unnamed protein product [Amoebophrya sp. A120]|eukprot:GSA120T00007885001.1